MKKNYSAFQALLLTLSLHCAEKEEAPIQLITHFSRYTRDQWQEASNFLAGDSSNSSSMQTFKKLLQKDPETIAANKICQLDAKEILKKLESELKEHGSDDPETELLKQFSIVTKQNHKSPTIPRSKKYSKDTWNAKNLAEKIKQFSCTHEEFDDEIYLTAFLIVYLHKIEEKKRNSSYTYDPVDSCIIV